MPSHPTQFLNVLQEKLMCRIVHRQYKIEIEFNDKLVRGRAAGYEFKKAGMIYYVFDLMPEKKITLLFPNGNEQFFRMIYCSEGSFTYGVKPEITIIDLAPVMEFLVSTSREYQHELTLEKGQGVSFHLIDFNKQMFWENRDKIKLRDLPNTLASTLQNKDPKSRFIYQTNYNIAIARHFTEIKESQYEGIIDRIFVESKLLEIIALSFHQYKMEYKSAGKRLAMKKSDVELLVEARSILHSDLKNPPTIKRLAKLAGINENKLKSGFKTLFNETINESLTSRRLALAKILLVQHNLSIREIASEVGYQNPGYFTKQFKKRFGVRPRDFIKSITLETAPGG